MTDDSVVDLYARHVNPAFVRLLGTFGYGRVFVRARGCTLFDDQEREYLDMLAAFGACNLGHNPPRLVEKMQSFLGEEAMNLIHVGPQPHAARLAADLAQVLKPPLEVSLFSNSGGEAVEAAIKLARAASGRSAIVYANGGFHGTGLGALSVLGHARLRKPFEPLLPDCHAVPFGDLDALKRALSENRAAAFIVEPIQAEAGVVMPAPSYLAEARALCKRRGAFFVLDEVQTGLGRTGSLFAYENAGVVPDVLVLGKSLGAGMVALSATVTSREIWQRAYGSAEKFDMHGSTYSGNALACRVGSEVVGELSTGDLVQASRVRGARFLAALRGALLGHPLVRDVRGAGLLIGVELGPTESTLAQRVLPAMYESITQKVFGQWLALRLLERGIVCQPASQHWNVLRLEPPLTVTDPEVDRTVAEIAAVLGEYTSLGPLMKDVAQRLGEQYRGGWAFR